MNKLDNDFMLTETIHLLDKIFDLYMTILDLRIQIAELRLENRFLKLFNFPRLGKISEGTHCTQKKFLTQTFL